MSRDARVLGPIAVEMGERRMMAVGMQVADPAATVSTGSLVISSGFTTIGVSRKVNGNERPLSMKMLGLRCVES